MFCPGVMEELLPPGSLPAWCQLLIVVHSSVITTISLTAKMLPRELLLNYIMITGCYVAVALQASDVKGVYFFYFELKPVLTAGSASIAAEEAVRRTILSGID